MIQLILVFHINTRIKPDPFDVMFGCPAQRARFAESRLQAEMQEISEKADHGVTFA